MARDWDVEEARGGGNDWTIITKLHTKERLALTASSSKPYSGSTAVREEDVSDGAGDESRASKDTVGERGGGTGIGDGNR